MKLAQNGYYDGKVFYGTDSKVVAGGMELQEEELDTDENVTAEAESEEDLVEETSKKVTAKEDKIRVSDLDKSVTPSESDNENDYNVSINGEFVANGFNDNTIRFEKGTVGLYRSNYSGQNLSKESYNSGTSLFFITTEEDSSLNGEYTAFGKVISGMDIIEKMLTLPLEEEETDENGNTVSSPTAGTISQNQSITKYAEGSYPVISKATVETYGVDYGIPKYEKAFDYNQYMSDLIMQYYSNQ